MPIDLSKVNISIQQFQNISSGKYNAGEVKLENETTLGKINNHVHFTGSNAKALSHQEVLAVKNAFIKALSQNGVDAAEIARIRRDLGLSADTGIDKSLHERSLRPLTRQQVREILDRNAATINAAVAAAGAAAGPIRTSAEMNAGQTERTIQKRKDARDAVNAGLAGSGGTKEHQGLAYAEAVVAGDVDFRSFDETRSLIAQAQAQLDQMLAKTHGNPSTTEKAVVEFRMKDSGQPVRIETGLTEAAFIHKLEETLVRLKAINRTDSRSIDVRTAFGSLEGAAARQNWLDGLAAAPDAGFKARTAAILMLTEAGIGDWETLSLVNRVSDANATAFAKGLAELDGRYRGDSLRGHHLLLSLAHQAAHGGADVAKDACATVPATSPQLWNKMVSDVLTDGIPAIVPHEFKALTDSTLKHLRSMFGSDAIGSRAHLNFYLNRDEIDELLSADAPVQAEAIRERLVQMAERGAAEMAGQAHLDRILTAAGAGDNNASSFFGDLMATQPNLVQRILDSRSAAETAAIINESRDVIEAAARRFVAVQRAEEKFADIYKNALARGMGLPTACFDRTVDLGIISGKAHALADKIRREKIPAADSAAVDAAFRSLAESLAAQRLAAFAKVDALGGSPALHDMLKQHLFDINRVDKFDAEATFRAAHDNMLPHISALEAALSAPGATKESVYEAMKPFSQALTASVTSLCPPGSEIGAEEKTMLGVAVTRMTILFVPGLEEKLAAFFTREDVRADSFINPDLVSFYASQFYYALPDPNAKANLVASLGTQDMPPFHAQALMQAFEDAGLGDRPIAEKMAILRASHPAGQAIATAINAAPGAVSPSQLRELAGSILQARADEAPTARSEADAARMDAILAKYDGGLNEADHARLREFAEFFDFSEAAAPTSEKAVAQRLDEICGGGDFDNPASSASRRALAAGASPADLPTLARVASLISQGIDYTHEEACDMLIDPASKFRTKWDAALRRLANDDPAELAKIAPAQKLAAAIAILECEDDAELLAVVQNGIDRVTRDGASHIRNADAIADVVKRVRDNLEELRAATAGDPAAFAAGLELLMGLETRRIPPGYIKHMVEAARRAPIDAVVKLRARSTTLELHAAFSQLYHNANSILAGADSGDLLDGADETVVCRGFLVRLMNDRLTQSQRRNVRDALAGQNAARAAALYEMISREEVDLGNVPVGVSGHAAKVGGIFFNVANLLDRFVRRSLGEANAPGRIPAYQQEMALGAEGILPTARDITAISREECDAARASYIRKAVPGATPAANALRGVFDAYLSISRTATPDERISSGFKSATSAVLNLNLVRGAKYLATRGLEQSQFARDRDRGMDVVLPDGSLLSTDAAVAADQLARFVTGREDASYAALAGAEKTKVHTVMALLTQESSTAAIEAPAVSLDPEGKSTAFYYAGNGQALRRSFRLAKTQDGGVSIAFETVLKPTALLIGEDAHQLGAGSEIKGSFTLSIPAFKFDAIGNLDFASADNDAAENVFRQNPPVAHKFFESLNSLPDPFRLSFVDDTETSLSFDFKAAQ